MAVDFATYFQQKYPPGAGRIYVAITGNDSNPGTQGSPKRTINAGLDALGSGGGIVWVGDGDYGTQSFSNRNYSSGAWALIMSQNLYGAKCSNTGGDVVQFTTCSYMGFYGFEVYSNENSGITTQIGICTGYSPGTWTHHLAIWRNHVHHMSQGGIGAAGNNHKSDYLDICYNWVHDTARWFYYAGSNISLYQQENYNPGDTGYHCNVIGNVCYYAHNEPGTARTDGNGIIIDDWMHTQSNNVVNSAKCLVAFNLCVNNGGRGVHSPWTTSAVHLFNTTAHNCWALDPGSQGGENALGGSSSRASYNISRPAPSGGALNQTWSQYFHDTYGGTISDNTALGGTFHGGDATVRNRTSEGLNYFKNNSPSLTPNTTALVDGWRPDGGSGIIEKTVVASDVYNALSGWVDFFGDYRPTQASGWAHGAFEATGGGTPPPGGVPVASFTVNPTTTTVGNTVSFVDTTTNNPTGWMWNFGDGSDTGTWLLGGPGAFGYVYTHTVNHTINSTEMTRVATVQATHISSFGAGDPQPTEGGAYDWAAIDSYVQRAQSADIPMIVLYGAPGWMRDGGGTYSENRISNSKADQFAELCKQVALRYTWCSHFTVWNEFKGFFGGTDHNGNAVGNTWNYVDYTWIYNKVWTAIKSVRPDVKIGGPYMVLDSWRTSVGASNPSVSWRGNWGVGDQRVQDSYIYFKNNALGFDYLAFDFGPNHRDGAALFNDTRCLDKAFDFITWLRGNISATVPIVCQETYTDPGPGALNDQGIRDLYVELLRRARNGVAQYGETVWIKWGESGFAPTLDTAWENQILALPAVTPTGTGTTSTLQNPTHAYATSGTKTVTLTASNGVGSNQTTRSVTVTALPQGPTTIVHPPLGTAGHLISATNLGSANGGTCYQITYQMQAAPGNGGGIINATGLAYIPPGTAPANGWRFLTTAHGVMNGQIHDYAAASAAGTGDNLQNSCGSVAGWLALGFAVVQVDYEGVYRGGDNKHYPVYNGTSFCHTMMAAAKSLAGITTIRSSGAAAGFSMGGPAALACAELQPTLYPEIQQFCAVAFDPWITFETTQGVYAQAGWSDGIAEYVYGQWLANPALNLASVVTADAITKIQNLDSYEAPYGIRTPADGGNGSTMSFIANPTTAGGGWAAYTSENGPGHRRGTYSRVYSPSTPYLYGQDIWLTNALAAGTPASRVVSSVSSGHAVFQDYQDGAHVWVVQTLDAQVTSNPVANFVMNPSPGVAGSAVAFTDASTNSPTSWAWNFGDGATSTTQSPSHTYAAAGTYIVSLTATGATGAKTTTKTLTVDPVGSSTSLVLQAEDAVLANTAYPGDIYAMHVTSEAAGYNGTGYVGFWGQVGERVTFTASGLTAGTYTMVARFQQCASDNPVPRQLVVNGTVVTTMTFSRTGTDWVPGSWTDAAPITVTLTGGSNTIAFIHNGAAGGGDFLDLDRITLTGQAPPAPPPTANWTRSASGNITQGDTVNFTDTSTGAPTSWNWTFGDGGISTAQNPSHTYLVAGTYTITLQAVNANGNTIKTGTIVVLPPVDPPPVANFTLSATLVVVGQNVTFTDTTTNNPTSWAWTFGDAGTSTTQNPVHAYAAPGTYSIGLTATSSHGSSSTSKQLVVVAVTAPSGLGASPINRETFTVMPKRELSLAETNDLSRIMSIFKPVSALMRIESLTATGINEIPLIRVASDSEWWGVVGEVVTKTGAEWAYAIPGDPTTPQEQPRPPFSLYQGESWSHAGDIAAVVSYAELAGQLIPNYYERIMFADDSHFDFAAELGVRWPQDVITERLASDGVMATNPLAHEVRSGKSRRVERAQEVQSRTATSRSAVSPMYFNGVDVEDLALRSDTLFSPFRRQAGVPQRFWSTPQRLRADPTSESLEVRLRTSQRINRIMFQVAHFPHHVWVESWSNASSRWDTVFEATISDSIPSNIVARVDAYGRIHPQHSMNGHWVPFDLRIDPVETTRFRVRLQRLATGAAPLDSKSQEMPYSLGVRGFDIGYVISSQNDVPRLLDPTQSIGASTDVVGSRVLYSIQEHVARHAVDGKDTTVWLSEPQPMAQAVVNFYVDTRTNSGDGRLIDRWYLDPARPGPLMNIYYSNSVPTDVLVASDTPLGPSEMTAQGTFAVVPGLGMSLSDSDPSWFEVDNSILQFKPSQSWWMAGEIVTRFSSYQANSPIASFGDFILQFSDDSIVFASPSGNDIVLPISYLPNQVVRYMIAYDADTNVISLSARIGQDDTTSVSSPLTHVIVGFIPSVRIATEPSHTLVANYRLRGFVLNHSRPPLVDDVFDDLVSYIIKPENRRDDKGLTNGALLRMHPDLVNDACPYGFLGGVGDSFSSLSWTPIPRDFRLQKGWVTIPPLKARFWKFEFSGLVMEPIEVQTPIERVVQLFPASALVDPNQVRDDPTLDIPAYHEQANRWTNYNDAPVPTPGPSTTDILPTSLLHAIDPAGPQRMRKQSWAYGFNTWHIGTTQPRFTQEGVHIYDTLSYTHTEKTGFFVGLKEIKAGLSNFQGGNDNPGAIVDRFFDQNLLSSSTWNITPGNAWTGASLGDAAVIESAVYPVRNKISGIQFATQQTDAIQIVPDDQFRDPSLAYSMWDDPDRWHRIGDATLAYQASEQQVLVRRAVETISNIDPHDQGLTQDPVHPVFSLAPQDSISITAGPIGGLASPFVKTTPDGMLYAAARITALTDLTNPLWVQIMDKDGVVLAEESVTAKRGDTVEWTASFSLSGYGTVSSYIPDYGDRTIVDRTVHPVFAGASALVDSNGGPGETTVPGYLFQVRLVQKDESQDAWVIDRLSMFDDSIIWEFSVDGGATYVPAFAVRNNPDGIISFARPGTLLRYRVTGLRANLHISSIQIRPQYAHYPTRRLANAHRGPNVSAYDHFPPIQDDPEFKRWNNPVPSWWWLSGQNILGGDQPIDGYPYSNEFSRTYTRQSTDDLSGMFDAVTRSVTFVRNLEETLTILDEV